MTKNNTTSFSPIQDHDDDVVVELVPESVDERADEIEEGLKAEAGGSFPDTVESDVKLDFADKADDDDPQGSEDDSSKAEKTAQAPSKGKHARHVKEEPPSKPEDNVPGYIKKSRRSRRRLIVIIIILIIAFLVGAYLVWNLFEMSRINATEQSQQTQDVESIYSDEAMDAASTVTHITEVPDLVATLGLTTDEALASLGHGASVLSTREVTDPGNIWNEVRVILTDEPSDATTGLPTVYLELNQEGRVIQVGYTTSSPSLGYGSVSFKDAIESEHIVERTLNAAGLDVAEGTISLPADTFAYSTYDGSTLVRESYSFNGEAPAQGANHAWSSVLSYDYSLANASGNLADTVRTIYVYINA